MIDTRLIMTRLNESALLAESHADGDEIKKGKFFKSFADIEKTCPFCGGKVVKSDDKKSPHEVIECTKCHKTWLWTDESDETAEVEEELDRKKLKVGAKVKLLAGSMKGKEGIIKDYVLKGEDEDDEDFSQVDVSVNGKMVYVDQKHIEIIESVDEPIKEEEEFDYIGELAYECPKCGESFASDIEIFDCTCPECEERITPVFLGEVEDIEDDEEQFDESVIKVTGGKVIRIAKKPKAGFKRLNGKYVKMSQKEIRARRKSIKKASKKAHRGMADRKRSKSLMKRQAMLANMELESFRMVEELNKVISEVYTEGLEANYHVPTVAGISEISISENNNSLDLECVVIYDDGVKESVEVSIDVNNGILTSESLFGASKLVAEFYDIDEKVLVPESLMLI